jgi:enoyl-CoA hydratase/carnithine racemase
VDDEINTLQGPGIRFRLEQVPMYLLNAVQIFNTQERFALARGLVNEVFAKATLEENVRGIAATIAENAPLTLRSAKRVIGELAREDGKRDREAIRRSIHACFESEDYREGVRAFLAKRKPVFQGR